MIFFPFYPALMLAVESHNVIDMHLWENRSRRRACGEEPPLMVSEKVDAAVEAGAMTPKALQK
jgi:hypothetical protein